MYLHFDFVVPEGVWPKTLMILLQINLSPIKSK